MRLRRALSASAVLATFWAEFSGGGAGEGGAAAEADGQLAQLAEESERLLDELCAFACQPPRTHTHHWREGDLVLWDNRCMLHRARPPKDPTEARVLRGTRVAGDAESETALPGGFSEEALAQTLARLRATKPWRTTEAGPVRARVQ